MLTQEERNRREQEDQRIEAARRADAESHKPVNDIIRGQDQESDTARLLKRLIPPAKQE